MRTRLYFLMGLMSLVAWSGQAFAEQGLSWEDCVREAKAHHPDLALAREKVSQAKAERTQASSAFWPQVSGRVDGDRSKNETTGRRVDSYSYSVSGQQLVFDGFKTYFDVEAAAKAVDSSQYNYSVTSSDVLLDLRTSYVELLKAQELLMITRKITERRQKSRDLIQLRHEAGREHKGSLLTAEANLAQALFEVEQARRNIQLSERRLSRHLGRGHLEPLSVQGSLDLVPEAGEKPDLEELAGATPFLRALIVEKEAAKWGVNSAIAGFFPQVYANASTGKSGTDWPPDDREWSVGASLSVPLFEGGNNVAELAKARASLGQAEAQERTGRDGVILTLEEKWKSLEDAIAQVSVQSKFLEAARVREEIAEAEYSNGLVTFNDWVIIEDNLVGAEKNYLNALAGALLAEAQWKQAKGETLDDE